MVNPNVLNQKWLSEIELLDLDMEPAEALKPQNVEKFFTSIISEEKKLSLAHGIINNLSDQLQETIPWFLSHMPPLYLWSTPERVVMDDLLTIISCKVLTEQQLAQRRNAAQQTVTIISSGEASSSSTRIGYTLSKSSGKMLRLFTSLDKKMGICEIHQSDYKLGRTNLDKVALDKLVSFSKFVGPLTQINIENFLAALDEDYIKTASVKQMIIAAQAVDYYKTNENAFVNLTTLLEEKTNQSRSRVDIALKNFPVNAAVEYVISIFNRYDFQVRRVLANEIVFSENEKYTVLHLVTAISSGEEIRDKTRSWGKTVKSLKALPYVDHDDECSFLLQGDHPFSINESNLVRAIANWVHIFLTKQNPYYYSLDRVTKILLNNNAHIILCLDYFRAKFDPRFNGKNRGEACQEYLDKFAAAESEITDAVERKILRESVNFLKHILKTNYFLISKGGLSFRIDPKCLDKEFYPETPFGIFYMIGRNFRCFQVRYRDISRGGMRVVIPRTSGDYENALAGLFDEVNGLAFAQQLKNKDIPEGGSKCVLVLKPGSNKNDAVKAAVSSLLDLINTESESDNLPSDIIDYYGKKEIIYLGPDENLTDDLIVWIIQHALHRGYRYAYAFMSSKPDFGINHKTYGVTSEGVNVYVDNVLRYLNLQDSSFRVKMTGGPDGDVAGNEMNILYREYGERCRLVAVADGLGAAHDPNGLDWPEILRLFRESRSIVDFNPEKLSSHKESFVIAANTKENIRMRDGLYAATEAEIFIPGGGRPYTVKDTNWEKYLKKDGTPSSLAIVEGANIFFTKEARQHLVDKGVVVIKDSSANKAGVSCSSYEIIACLTLSPEEFSALKSTYVDQVLGIIRQNADKEAKLLFREWKRNPNNSDLVKLSYEISSEINIGKDLLREKLDALTEEQLADSKFEYVLFKHCPPVLTERYPERIRERLPRAHKIAILSAYMASHLIYREGLHWLQSLHADQIFKLALDYMEAERMIEKMIDELDNCKFPYKREVSEILRHAGAKQLASLNL